MIHVARQACRLSLEGLGTAGAGMAAELETIEGIELVTSDAPQIDCVYRHYAASKPTPPLDGPRTVTFIPDPSMAALDGVDLDSLTRDNNMIVVASRWAKERMVDRGIAVEKIAIVPHGVDPQVFAPLSLAERVAVRAKLGIGADEIILLNVSDSSFDAGFDLLMTAFATLRARGHNVRLALKHEDLTAAPNYQDALVKAAAASPAILQPATLDAILILPSGLPHSDLRLLYGMADCYVSPYRTTPFNMAVLEAIATGTPVIVTDGGATDDICDHDVAWRISSVPFSREDRDTGRTTHGLEPDIGELTDALTQVVAGRGFDRIRFANARLRILAEFGWARVAADLAKLAAGPSLPVAQHAKVSSETGISAPTSLPRMIIGLPRPTTTRFAEARHPDMPGTRRYNVNRSRRADTRSLSVVVQGPCVRAHHGKAPPSMDDALASIRRHFPGAQLVVSTWLGSDIDGLDADDIVLSADPGPLEDGVNLPNNVNRMVTATTNGLAAATRPFCIKTRNDVLFASDAFACKELWRAADILSLERRIWIEANRLETSLRPFCPSDKVQYGLTDDLRRLWDVPALRHDQLFFPEPKPHFVRMDAEQAVFTGYLGGIGIDAKIDHTFDGRPEIIAMSLECMLGAFNVYDEDESGIVLTSRFRDNKRRLELLETYRTFEALRSEFKRDRLGTIARVQRDYHATIQSLNSRK